MEKVMLMLPKLVILFLLTIATIMLFYDIKRDRDNIGIALKGIATFILAIGILGMVGILKTNMEETREHIIYNYEGKIPQNGKIITEATFCFSDDKLTKISLDGKCSK